MGSGYSGTNNDELVDYLRNSQLILTDLNELTFRTVDRGTFYLPEFKHLANNGYEWQEGIYNVSAPLIHSLVLNSLELEKSISFLNIGSGTGYFSTLVGLILGNIYLSLIRFTIIEGKSLVFLKIITRYIIMIKMSLNYT